MKRQDDLPTFAGLEGSDTQQFMNPRDAARSLLERHRDTLCAGRRRRAGGLRKRPTRSLAEISQAEKSIGDRAGNEFRSSITDFRILAALARY